MDGTDTRGMTRAPGLEQIKASPHHALANWNAIGPQAQR